MIENNALIPKKIKLIVNKAENLELYHPKKKIKNQPNRWRVLFIGVVEKLATAKVISETGNPEWLCEITVTAKNAQDPITLLVTDSKGRHIGQVVVSLSKVPPPPPNMSPGERPPLVLSNIYRSELEPTKKNSYPKGYLYYWMWTTEYWKFDEIVRIKQKMSLSKSMHDLSNSTLNLFRRKKSTSSIQDFEQSPNNSHDPRSTQSTLRGSPLKISNLKKKIKPGSDSSSSVNSQTLCQPISQLAGHSNGFNSKNPFDTMITADISIENNIKQEEPYRPGNPGYSAISPPKITLHHEMSVGSKINVDNPFEPTNKKKAGLFAKFKFNKSQSSVDLTKIPSEIETNHPVHITPQSLGKQQGQRLFEKKNDFSKSSVDVSGWIVGDTQIIVQNNNNNNDNIATTNNGSKRLSRPQSCLIRTDNFNLPSKHPLNPFDLPNGLQDHTYVTNNLSRNTSVNGYRDIQLMNKNREDMSKRELIDLAEVLENQLKEMTDKCRTAQVQADKLAREKRKIDDDLSIVSDELCRLRLRLLEGGETRYLEMTDNRTRADVLTDLTRWRASIKFKKV